MLRLTSEAYEALVGGIGCFDTMALTCLKLYTVFLDKGGYAAKFGRVHLFS